MVIRLISSISFGMPALVTEETSAMGASARKVSDKYSETSSRTSSSQSASTISTLVRTTIPCLIFRSEQISRCSRVCGMTPSSAAITRATRSIPVAPATIFLTNFSWPGTSTIPSILPSGKARWAKPSSMVIPRSFSSFKRSVSIPVSALISDVFPWSMWPAVPRIICFMKPSLNLLKRY